MTFFFIQNQAVPPPPLQANASSGTDTWTEVTDKITGGVYYWNRSTGETTPVGEAKPTGMYRTAQPAGGMVTAQPTAPAEVWTAVTHPTSGGVYYWNQATGETTAVGEPKPTGMHRVPAAPQFSAQKVGTEIGSLVLWGAGLTVGFAIAGAAMRAIFG